MKINFQVVSLRFVALALSGLLGILVLGGIEAIARVGFANSQISGRAVLVEAADAGSSEATISADADQNNPWASWRIMPQSANPAPAAVPTVPAAPARPSSRDTKPADRSTQPPSGNRPSPSPTPAPTTPAARPATRYQPREQVALANATNYGDRVARDVYGNPVNNAPIIVLHETVGSADSAIQLFRTAHRDESMQASYHSIIREDGTVVYVVSPEKRAFGAGNSVFNGSNGPEAVKTHRLFPPSVNNFAYHISLETPIDGEDNQSTHSGYTDRQYQSLAWLIARTGVPVERITTHQAVDRSQSRMDPRSFDRNKFLRLLAQYQAQSDG
ncbi:N-acetylmuramoyl-L-alanine amidase [Leptolyngbya ohadii]|uniref:N-acetylmuramoyl-L-alanine amidase n=1 Tax=Leptolyngbya ohadii TaxID=1962290 RepID=UPI0015C61E05|nr:peptidoglycan recognition family protein [Leptolyngbya ohadii]